jgi:hypothetical protein
VPAISNILMRSRLHQITKVLQPKRDCNNAPCGSRVKLQPLKKSHGSMRPKLLTRDEPRWIATAGTWDRHFLKVHLIQVNARPCKRALLTTLCEGQQATVLQLPAEPETAVESRQPRVAYIV